MEAFLQDYFALIVFLGIALALSLALLAAPMMIAVRNPDPEKNSIYECGFEAFDDARAKFDIRFYLVAMLFIVFDLEAVFLFPFALTFKEIGDAGFWAMMVFLAELALGLVYAWHKGALEWD